MVGENGHRNNLCFHKIIKKVCAERNFGCVILACKGHFTQDRCMIDILIADAHTKIDIIATPPARPEYRKTFILKETVETADHTPDSQFFVIARKFGIGPWTHINHIFDVGYNGARHHLAIGEDNLFLREILRQFHFTDIPTHRQRTTLKNIKVLIIPGKFDIYGTAVGILKLPKNFFH